MMNIKCQEAKANFRNEIADREDFDWLAFKNKELNKKEIDIMYKIERTQETDKKLGILWEVLKEAKKGEDYVSSTQLYSNFQSVLANMNKETIKTVYFEFQLKKSEITNSLEFENLHVSHGGIVNGGDDAFYMDFGSWLLAQGEDLYTEFKEKGHTAVLDYIKKYNVCVDDYRFECMIYAFHDYI